MFKIAILFDDIMPYYYTALLYRIIIPYYYTVLLYRKGGGWTASVVKWLKIKSNVDHAAYVR